MKAFLQELLRSRWKRTLALVSISAVGALILLDQVIMPLVIHSRSTVTVPNVIGMAQEQAVALLNQQGLVVQDVQQQYDSTQPAGRVVLQSPYPGAIVRQGRRVYLVVSRGEESVALRRHHFPATGKPHHRESVAWHTPIRPWGKSNRPNFGTIW